MKEAWGLGLCPHSREPSWWQMCFFRGKEKKGCVACGPSPAQGDTQATPLLPPLGTLPTSRAAPAPQRHLQVPSSVLPIPCTCHLQPGGLQNSLPGLPTPVAHLQPQDEAS